MDPHAPIDYDPHAAQHMAEFAIRRKRQRAAGFALLFVVFLIISALIGLILGVLPPRTESFMAIVSLAFLSILAHGIFAMINCRCPRCNKGQTRVRNPRFCFNCGLRLRE